MPMAIPQQGYNFQADRSGGTPWPRMMPSQNKMALWQGLQGAGQNMQAQAAPRFASAPQGGGMGGMMQFPMGLLGMFGGGQGGGMGGFLDGLLQQIPEQFRTQAGLPTSVGGLLSAAAADPSNRFSWDVGTQTIPSGTPASWFSRLFNRG